MQKPTYLGVLHDHDHDHETDRVCPWIRAATNVFSQTPPFGAGRSRPIPSSPGGRDDRDQNTDA